MRSLLVLWKKTKGEIIIKKFKFLKIRMIWGIIRGRTVMYNTHINMKGNVVNVTKDRFYIVNSRIDFTQEGGMIIESM